MSEAAAPLTIATGCEGWAFRMENRLEDVCLPGGIYSAFGLDVRSEMPLPELLIGEREATVAVVVRRGEVPEELPGAGDRRGYFQVAGECILIRVAGVARYLVKAGREVTIAAEADAADEDVRAFLLTVVFGAVLHQRDELVLHGSAVGIDGHAAAFVGPSGAGKSTLAAAFRNRGYPVLSDDLCLVRPAAAGAMMLQPSFPHMKLWLDSLDQLKVPAAGLRRILRKGEKRAMPLSHGFAATALPLKKIYVLRRSHENRLSITPVERIGAVRALKNHTYRFGLLESLGKQRQHFAQVVALAERVPLAIVARPLGEFRLEELLSAIETDIRLDPP